MNIRRANSYALHALMHMVRHMTQLPLTIQAISKAEGIPYRQLVGLFHLLADAGIIKNADPEQAGYVFAKPPSETSLLEIFELIEGKPIFKKCFLQHGECKATVQSCEIYAAWRQAMEVISKKLSEITVEKAAWGHPEHFFQHCCFNVEHPKDT